MLKWIFTVSAYACLSVLRVFAGGGDLFWSGNFDNAAWALPTLLNQDFVLQGAGDLTVVLEDNGEDYGIYIVPQVHLASEERDQLLYFLNLVLANQEGYGEYQTEHLFDADMGENARAPWPLVAWLRSHDLITNAYFVNELTMGDLVDLIVDYFDCSADAINVFDACLMSDGIALFDRVYQYLLAHGATPIVARSYARSAVQGVRVYDVPFQDALEDALVSFMESRYRQMGVPGDNIQHVLEQFHTQYFVAGADARRAFVIGFYEGVEVPFEFIQRAADIFLDAEEQALANEEAFDAGFTLRWALLRAYGLLDDQAQRAARWQVNLERLVGESFSSASWAAFARYCGLIPIDRLQDAMRYFKDYLSLGHDPLSAWALVFYVKIRGMHPRAANGFLRRALEYLDPMRSGYSFSFVDAVVAAVYGHLGVPAYVLEKAVARQRVIMQEESCSFMIACWRALFESLGISPEIAAREALWQEKLLSRKNKRWSLRSAHLLCLARCFNKKISFKTLRKLISQHPDKGIMDAYELNLRIIFEITKKDLSAIETMLYGPQDEKKDDDLDIT